jgi:lipopolysaccharide transport protein LptA
VKLFPFVAIAAFCGLTVCAQSNTNAIDEILALVKTNSVPAPKPARPPTLINSDSADFDLANHQVVYRGHVRVDDPEMKLASEWLVADLPPSGGHVNHIVAETNVVIDFTDEKGQAMHATSDKVIYDYQARGSVTNETVTFTGNAKVENVQGWLTGEPIIWDRANNHLNAMNQKMVFRQNLTGAPADTNSPETNNLPVPK